MTFCKNNRKVEYAFLLILILTIFCFPKISTAAVFDIIPFPQEIVEHHPKKSIQIDNDWIVIDSLLKTVKGNNDDINIQKQLKSTFKQKGLNIPIFKDEPQTRKFQKAITLFSAQNLPASPQVFYKKAQFKNMPYNKDDARYQESYQLDIYKNGKYEGIQIIAGGLSGAFYAIQTLDQLIGKDGKIRCVTIIDYPDMRLRGAMFDLREIVRKQGYKSLSMESFNRVKKELEPYTRLKLNTFFIKSPEFYSMDSPEKAFFDTLFEHCRERFIQPIPVIGSKLWDIPYQKIVDDAVEGFWVKDEAFYVDGDGYLKPVSSSDNVLENGAFELSINHKNTAPHWNTKIIDNKNYWQIIEEQDVPQPASDGRPNSNVAQCAVSHLAKPYRLKLQPENDTGETLIPVAPSSYYELGFWNKRSAAEKIRFRVSIKQYDKDKKFLEPGGNNLNFFHLWTEWRCRWQALFTQPDCRYINVSFMPQVTPTQSGDIYLDNISLKRMNGGLLNVFDNDESRIDIRNLDGSVRYRPGLDYTVSKKTPDDVCILSNNSIEKTVIKRTQTSKLKVNQTVKISYDARPIESRTVPRSKYCPSSFETYNIYRQVFSNLLRLDPDYIHISMDEHHGGFNRDSRCLERHLTNSEIFALFINNLNRILHSDTDIEVLPGKFIKGLNRPQIRLIMWDDMVNPWHNGNNQYYQNRYGVKTGKTYLAMPETPIPGFEADTVASRYHIAKDVIMASWWYKPNDSKDIIKNASTFYGERGFDYITCAWVNEENIKLWSKNMSGKKTLGMMATTWNHHTKGIPIVAQYSWNSIDK